MQNISHLWTRKRRENLNLPACVFTLGFNRFRVQSTIHGRAVKNANGTAVTQNRTIEAEIKQAHTDSASQVRGLAEKLEPKPARRAVGKKKAARKKPVVTKRKPEGRRGRVKPTGKVIEPTETATT
jgi:hypothetical protein